jgi:hypothetical protein
VRLNEDHPDCKEYRKKWDMLVKHYLELEKLEAEKYPDWKPKGGFDGPSGPGDTDKIHRELNRKLTELKKEYSYLYTEK